MSSQVLAPAMVGHDLSIHATAASSEPSEDLPPAQAQDTSLHPQHSLPDQSSTRASLLSQTHTDHVDTQQSHQCDQATFEQTQRAVGNLLDALRTNNGPSHAVKDGIGKTSRGALERMLDNPEMQRPSVSPLDPQSTSTPVAPSTDVTFPGAQDLQVSIGAQLADRPAEAIADIFPPLEASAALDMIQSRDPQYTSIPEQTVVGTVEEELPLNVQNAQDTGQISAFAKLEFDDGPFYITTYSLELGRDARAYRAAKARLAEQQVQQKGNRSSSGNSHPSSRSKREGGSQVKGSVVSDRGGFYGVDDIEGEAQEADEERQRQQAAGSQSSNHSTSSIVNPKDLHTRPPLPHFNYQAYPIDEYEREIEEIPAPVTSEHFPKPEEGFLLPIHHAPVKDDLEQDVANHRSVSRRHAKIFWEDDCFKFHVKGVNGAFVNEVFYPKGAILSLREDMSIQIKGIKFQFKLPVHSSIESSEESDHVEDDSPNQNAGSSSATSAVERTASPNANKSPLKVKIRNFKRPSPPPSQPILGPDGKPKRRGPGRPPKDGIMSKRERVAKERADREAAAKAANGGVTPEPVNRGRSGRPGVKTTTEIEEPKPAKRKYTKRKSVNQDPDDVTPKLEEDSEGAVGDAPPTKRARANRSESPEYPKLEDLSEKDLQRPPYNYSILIYDLLKDSPKPLDLKGIYRGLKMKWPHFLYRYKDAKGWESSVRHNVNEDKLKIIEKVDRVGKGYSYRAKPGVDIEQHKKKRARSPTAGQKMSAISQQRYQQQPHPPPPGAYAHPFGQQPPASHGMYGHLVPTTVPQSSMSYSMSYSPAMAGPSSSSPLAPTPHYATSGPAPLPMAYTMASGHQSTPATAGVGQYAPPSAAYPAPPALNQAVPAPYHDQPQQQPSHPPSSTSRPPAQNQPSSTAVPCQTPFQPAHQTSNLPPSAPPPPPPGISPFSPFLPAGLSVIATFESSLLDGVENSADVPRIKATLASVRKRVFEGENASSLPGGETQDERTFLHYFRHILENERFRNPGFVGWEAVRREREREGYGQGGRQGMTSADPVVANAGLELTGDGSAEREAGERQRDEDGSGQDEEEVESNSPNLGPAGNGDSMKGKESEGQKIAQRPAGGCAAEGGEEEDQQQQQEDGRLRNRGKEEEEGGGEEEKEVIQQQNL